MAIEKTRFDAPKKEVRYKRCETCVAWAPAEAGRMPTTCRAGLPSLVPMNRPEGMALIGVWPPAEATDWCMKWEQGSHVSSD